MKKRTYGLVLISLLAWPWQAAAVPAEAPAGAPSLGREHFQRGVELYRDGNFDSAAAEFSRAYELTSDYRLLYNMGQVQAERHDYVAAIGLLEKYLTQGGDEIDPTRRADVSRDLATLRQRTAELWVSSNVDDAELWINDSQVESLPLRSSVVINSGVCRVRIEKRGYQSATHTLIVAGGDKPRVELPLVATVAPPPQPAAEARAPASDNTALWFGVAGTAVSGGLAVGFAVMTRNADERLDRELGYFPVRAGALAAARTRLKTVAVLTDAFTATTAVAAGLSLYLLFSSSSEQTQESPGPVGLRVVPDRSGVWLLGGF